MSTRLQKAAPVFAMLLFGLLLACVLGLVQLGSGLYKALALGQQSNDAARSSLRYLSTRVRGADRLDALRLAEGPEGVALILAEGEEEGGYETRIYLYQGSLLEDYAPAGSPLAPQEARPVASTSCFEAQLSEPGLLRLTTGEGTAWVAMRSGEGRWPHATA